MNYNIVTVCIFLIFCTDKSSVMSLWDFAATVENKIIFFDNDWNEMSAAAHQFTKLSGLTFDEIEEKLYFSDQYHNNGSIFSLKLPNNINGINSNSGQINALKGETKIEIIEKIVARVNNETIGGLTYDPYDRYLYWTDKSNKKIYRLYTSSLGDSQSNKPEIFLNLSNDSLPEGITIDICNRILYWTNSNIKNPSIERISLKSADKKSEIIVNKDLFQPRGILLDQYSKRIFWVVNLPGIHYAVESSNLDGGDRQVIYKGLHNEPFDLTVTKDLIYWTDVINEAVWNISKSAGPDDKPQKVYSFKDKPRGIISRFGLLQKLANVPECKEIISTIKNRLKEHINIASKLSNSSLTIKSMNIAKPHVYCLNNGEYNPFGDTCICKVGYSGLRCEFNDCTNYCVHGTCEISAMGFPECICNEGFYGIRCEAFKCADYCLNGGYCEINQNKPKCECSGLFNGERCEQNLTETCTLLCTIQKYNPNYDVPINCNEICFELNDSNNTESRINEIYKNLKENNEKIFNIHMQQKQIEHHDSNLNTCNSTYTIIIICLSVLLAFTIVLLIIFTIRKLSKPPRPKIRKTFVVQKRINGNYKNVNGTCGGGGGGGGNTPLTSRPLSSVEKCEITIEDCCNMNICDTPCFDPKVLQQSFDNCSKNDDKKILVDNMEEDLY